MSITALDADIVRTQFTISRNVMLHNPIDWRTHFSFYQILSTLHFPDSKYVLTFQLVQYQVYMHTNTYEALFWKFFVKISRSDIILNLDLYVCTVFWSIKCCFIINLSWLTITFIYSKSQVHYITFRLITLRYHDFLLDLVVRKKGYVGENISLSSN